MNKLKKTIREVRGSALLVALLVMGVLIALSLALSSLIIGESRSTKQLIDAGRAYYAAESGIEQALYNLDTNLPGWEGKEANIGKVGEMAVFSYELKNKCNSYPCFDPEEYDVASMLDYKFYDILELNETLTIPLFTVDEMGEIQVVEDFTVEFFVSFNPATDLIFDTGQISGWDVLRWKIFALRETSDGSFITESLHDFTAVSSAQNVNSGEQFVTNATEPSWFGTIECGAGGDRINSDIICHVYQNPGESFEGQYCINTEARDFYLYDSQGERFQAKLPCFSIWEFLQRNNPDNFPGEATGLNYLSLTNLMNPAMLDPEMFNNEERLAASRIYFRVETFDKDTTRESASITSDGFSGDTKQSLSVDIKRDSYMPVFNFSVYSTYGSENEYYVESDPKALDGLAL
ncbi:MAG: pilus assembly PilX N-terminal domain-containing protein [Nitrospirota bacterium]